MKIEHLRRGWLVIAAITFACTAISALGCATIDGDEQNYRELQRDPTLFDPELDPLHTHPERDPRLAPMRPGNQDGPLLLLVGEVRD